MNDLITGRLVEMTFAPLDEVAGWLVRLGMEVRQREEQTITVRNPFLNITTALLPETDPVTQAVCLATVLLGMHWPQICPALLTGVNREWRRRQRPPAAGSNSPGGPVPKGRSPARAPAATPTFTDLFKPTKPQ